MERIKININVKDLIKSNPDIDIEGWIKKTFGLSDNNEESSKMERKSLDVVLTDIEAIFDIKIRGFKKLNNYRLKVWADFRSKTTVVELTKKLQELGYSVLTAELSFQRFNHITITW